jgi:signal transduction histidine kinase
MTYKIIESLQEELDRKQISVEIDADELIVIADKQLIWSAAEGMIRHAIDNMPNGGEITVIVVDSSNQWELEVADSARHPPKRAESAMRMQCCANLADNMPTAVAFPSGDFLQPAHQAAMLLGGQIQCWDCPQGGTAFVMVIPKRLARLAA